MGLVFIKHEICFQISNLLVKHPDANIRALLGEYDSAPTAPTVLMPSSLHEGGCLLPFRCLGEFHMSIRLIYDSA
jgi:hypothetical protein